MMTDFTQQSKPMTATEMLEKANIEAKRQRTDNTFVNDMIRFHRGLIRNELCDRDREALAYIIEAMTNINTPEKGDVFNDLVSCSPKLNYGILARVIY